MKSNVIRLTPLVESILREEDMKKQVAAMDAAMGNAFKTLGAEFEANKEEIQQDVAQSQSEVNEALGILGILGLILALPKVLELFVKGLGKIVSVWKSLVKPGQAKGSEEEFAKGIIDFSHKWHKAYIKGIKWILKVSGAFKKAGIQGDAAQDKAAEMVFYIIIAGLAVWSGIGAGKAFANAVTGSSGGSFSLSAFEAAMASIKATEVKQFLTKIGLTLA